MLLEPASFFDVFIGGFSLAAVVGIAVDVGRTVLLAESHNDGDKMACCSGGRGCEWNAESDCRFRSSISSTVAHVTAGLRFKLCGDGGFSVIDDVSCLGDGCAGDNDGDNDGDGG